MMATKNLFFPMCGLAFLLAGVAGGCTDKKCSTADDAAEAGDAASRHEVAGVEAGELPEVAERPAYGFLSGASDADKALASLWEAGFTHPASQDEVDALVARKMQAEASLMQNLPEARQHLLDTLNGLRPDAGNEYLGLKPLLELIGDDPAILEKLRTVMMAPPQTESPPGEEGSPENTVRWVAVKVTFHLAKKGSAAARDNLLHGLESGHPYVRRLSVRYTYALNPDRRLAKRLMRPLLPCEEEYLLYEE